LQATLAPAEGPREDVVLSEVRVAPAPASEPVPVSDPAASYRDLDARSAINKAREAYRERIRLDPRRLFEEPVVAAASLPAADPEPLLGESPWGGEPAATCRNEPLDEADGVVEVDDDDIDDMAEQFVSTLAVDHMEPAADRDAFGLDEWDDVDDDAVRALVAGAVNELAVDDVAIIRAERLAAPSRVPHLVLLGPIAVTSASATALKTVLAASFATNLILVVIVVLARARRRTAVQPGPAHDAPAREPRTG
jgi:hypothetical protein